MCAQLVVDPLRLDDLALDLLLGHRRRRIERAARGQRRQQPVGEALRCPRRDDEHEQAAAEKGQPGAALQGRPDVVRDLLQTGAIESHADPPMRIIRAR